jgi:outer membrane protein TolC
MSWFEAVASEQQLTLYDNAFVALSANAELAKRMKKTGNMTTSDRVRQQLIYSEATVALAKAKMRKISSRENLIRKIGLTESEANNLTIPKKLPELPKTPISIEKIADKISDRFDVKTARIEYELLLEQLGVEKINSYTDIEFGYRNDRIKDDGVISNKKGYELEIKIPIFDWGNLQRDTIQADLIAKQKIYENIVLAAASELREAYQNYRTAFDIAKHYYDQIIPMHEILLEEATYNYNGMIIGIFELMQSGLEKSTAEIKATDALQNLFTAELNLNSVVLGRKLGAKSRTTEIASNKAKKGH